MSQNGSINFNPSQFGLSLAEQQRHKDDISMKILAAEQQRQRTFNVQGGAIGGGLELHAQQAQSIGQPVNAELSEIDREMHRLGAATDHLATTVETLWNRLSEILAQSPASEVAAQASGPSPFSTHGCAIRNRANSVENSVSSLQALLDALAL